APGAFATVTFTAKPGTSVSVGTATVTLHVTGAAGSADADASATLLCTTAAPTLSATPNNPTGAINQAQAYTVTLVDNDTLGCPSVSWALTTDELAGWTYAGDTNTFALSGGTSTQTSITVTPTSSVVAGGTFNHVVH